MAAQNPIFVITGEKSKMTGTLYVIGIGPGDPSS